MDRPDYIHQLLDSRAYPHPASDIHLLETHISWVILTGHYAYKIKKPVKFEFLDFTPLESRQHYCSEELRLNQRLAPEIYLDVVPVTVGPEGTRINGTGTIVDYAVKMRQFPQQRLGNLLASQGGLTSEHMTTLASKLGAFHATAAVASAQSEFSSARSVIHVADDNLRQVAALLADNNDKFAIQHIEHWAELAKRRLRPLFDGRKRDGFVRECHGDLHLGNIAFIDSSPLIFDCIEFNEEFRWIDTMSDVGFLVMDLHFRKLELLASQFLNAYLEQTGDYQGCEVLSYYMVYRALVRCKVALLKQQQDGGDNGEHRPYLELAHTFTKPKKPLLVLMCGFSGSGKTWLGKLIAGPLDAIQIRSDIERKRMFGLSGTHKPVALDSGIYTQDASEATYRRLAVAAESVLKGGFTAIVDATFLKAPDRQRFCDHARVTDTPVCVVHVHAPAAVLRQRIRNRAEEQKDASDATLEVLNAQLGQFDKFREDEQRRVVDVENANALDIGTLVKKIRETALAFG